ncbi:MAG: MBL fold metallo-hydrolase [Desulfitobacteriaceae bacterium]
MITMKILVENRARRRGILAEHGLSMLIEYDDFKVLFDVGQTDVFSLNAKTDGIDLATVDALVISHGHYDHAGGVPEFCRLNNKASIYIHPDAFCERYIAQHGKPVGGCIGMPWSCENKDSFMHRMTFVKQPVKIHNNITLSGQVSRDYGLKKISTGLIKKNANGDYEKDAVLDEQFLIITGREGIYLFVGCSHPGILNCLAYAKQLFSCSKISGLIGGLHLEKYSNRQLQDLVSALKLAGVEKIVPLHCTKIQASYLLESSFGENCLLLNSGDELVLEN